MPDSPAVARDQDAAAVAPAGAEFERIRQALRGIRFGEVRVIIQDGVIVQIERLEKHRLR